MNDTRPICFNSTSVQYEFYRLVRQDSEKIVSSELASRSFGWHTYSHPLVGDGGVVVDIQYASLPDCKLVYSVTLKCPSSQVPGQDKGRLEVPKLIDWLLMSRYVIRIIEFLGDLSLADLKKVGRIIKQQWDELLEKLWFDP